MSHVEMQYVTYYNGHVIEVNGKRYALERTCCVEDTHAGPGIFEYELSCGHACEWTWPIPPMFCPSCGARVKEEA